MRKTRAVALKRFCLAMNALSRTVTLKTTPPRAFRHKIENLNIWNEIWYEIDRFSEGLSVSGSLRKDKLLVILSKNHTVQDLRAEQVPKRGVLDAKRLA